MGKSIFLAYGMYIRGISVNERPIAPRRFITKKYFCRYFQSATDGFGLTTCGSGFNGGIQSAADLLQHHMGFAGSRYWLHVTAQSDKEWPSKPSELRQPQGPAQKAHND